MSIADLFIANDNEALRAPSRYEAFRIIKMLIGMPNALLARIAKNDLEPIVRGALPVGGILQIGLGTQDVEICGRHFAARCDLRLVGRQGQYEIRVEGKISEEGDPVLSESYLLSHAA